MAWSMHRVGAGFGPPRVERRSATRVPHAARRVGNPLGEPAPTRGIASIRLRALGLLALLLGLLALPPGVAAHTGVPERQERVQAGPYTLELRYYSVPRSGQNLVLMIVPVAGGQPAAIQVTAVPGAGVDAPAAAVRTAPDPDDPTATDALIPIAAPGLWVITVAATGPAGTGQAELGLLAATPGAIPIPVGWAIGLSPLIGIIGFAAAQRRWLKGMRNAEWRVRNDEGTGESPELRP